MTEPSGEALAERWGALRAEVDRRAGEHVTIVAVTKGHPPAVARAAAVVGIGDLGESYAAELVEKGPVVEGVRWHFIGRLQRNKVRLVAPWVHLWQSVDRAALGAEIAKRAPGAAVLVQVNASGEAQKGGAPPGEVEALVADLAERGLDVRGLMTIGVQGDAGATADAFAATSALADDLALPVRSFGMSDDWRLALDHGATLLRIGSALVGPRNDPRPGHDAVGH